MKKKPVLEKTFEHEVRSELSNLWEHIHSIKTTLARLETSCAAALIAARRDAPTGEEHAR